MAAEMIGIQPTFTQLGGYSQVTGMIAGHGA